MKKLFKKKKEKILTKKVISVKKERIRYTDVKRTVYNDGSYTISNWRAKDDIFLIK